MSQSIKNQLEIILLQEEKCQFNLFTSQTALDLGLMLIENAKPFNKPVVIDITMNGHQLFHYAMQGTNKDNDEWVRRYLVTLLIAFIIQVIMLGGTWPINISEKDYATHGGAFPLTIKNVGVVGTITVSGLMQEDDHNLVANTIQELLAIQQKQ
ncbi:hypothetical protein G6F46_003922 [Rhizopus delemar]|uniref:Uncharacterized protein n=2 Tax=Rhizopus TaxID=4842 RepID=A0A9P6Z950_9FUNG|nr:hypothetical protein G6F55_007588 [Rhizopus delemar]KAG1547811.1 hypothetical protein G6F51_004042 [Rhizopus arrhizus]KAG1501044.1 hypothetical protein G6F54_003310 [Rhizopus delemar]KAG1514714.1 hypothetical protein G6F53_003467 [Rhizopus delemar]KAG1523178.1 hypothetical protein G6F52_005236 [Rhizopus delemar]